MSTAQLVHVLTARTDWSGVWMQVFGQIFFKPKSDCETYTHMQCMLQTLTNTGPLLAALEVLELPRCHEICYRPVFMETRFQLGIVRQQPFEPAICKHLKYSEYFS